MCTYCKIAITVTLSVDVTFGMTYKREEVWCKYQQNVLCFGKPLPRYTVASFSPLKNLRVVRTSTVFHLSPFDVKRLHVNSPDALIVEVNDLQVHIVVGM